MIRDVCDRGVEALADGQEEFTWKKIREHGNDRWLLWSHVACADWRPGWRRVEE